MKPVIIIAIAFVVLVSIPVFAQEESLSELKARLDAENLQKAQEAGSKVTASPIPQEDTLDCPEGTYHGLDNQGNPACRTIQGNQIFNPDTDVIRNFDVDQTGEMILDDEQMMYIGIGVVVLIIFLAIVGKAASKSESYKDVERAHFTPKTKEQVKELQHGKCVECGKFPTHWEFDHIDSRGDNSIENCQGLCLDCHQTKTLEDNVRHRDSEDD